MKNSSASKATRRFVLKGGAAAAVGGLTGCAVTGKPSVDRLIRTVGGELGSQLASDTIFAAVGVPNRLKFVSGRPMTADDKRQAAVAQSLINASGASVNELPIAAMAFNPTVPRRVPGAGQATWMRQGMFAGADTAKGRAQVDQVKRVVERYKGVKTLTIPQALDIADTFSPFMIAERAIAESKQGINPTLIEVPPGSSISVAARTGCLGAGLPLPRAGEGARLVYVPQAVHPDQRPAVEGLLQLSVASPNDMYVAQYLIWNLIHADNSGYKRILDQDISGRYRDLLDRAVPGGWRRYRQLVEEARARREIEEKKLAMAKLAIAQLGSAFGMSFQLKAPGAGAGNGGSYAENLLRQGYEQGTRDLQALAKSASRELTRDLLNQALSNGKLGKWAPVARDAANAAQDGLIEGLLGDRSVFDPLQGYTLLAPGVAAHVSDFGGASTGAILTLANGNREPHYVQTAGLSAVTPRLTQAQTLVPYLTGQKSPIPAQYQRDVDWATDALVSLLKNAAIMGADNFVGKHLWPWWTPNRLKAIPVFGTLVAIHTAAKYIGHKFGHGDGTDIWGSKISDVGFAVAMVGALFPSAGIASAIVGAYVDAHDARREADFAAARRIDPAVIRGTANQLADGFATHWTRSEGASGASVIPADVVSVMRTSVSSASATFGDMGEGVAQSRTSAVADALA